MTSKIDTSGPAVFGPTWWGRQTEGLWPDVKFASRRLRTQTGMTLLVVLSLALCLGSSTAVFSIVDAVVLRKLAVSKPEQLVFVRAAVPGDPSTSSSSRLYDVVRANHPGLRGVVAQSGTLVTGTVAGQARLMRANFVSGDYFPLLGVNIFRGRMLSPFDDTPSATAAAVISHALWKQMGAAESIVGDTVTVEKVPFVIVGIVEPSFVGTSVGGAVDLWMPLTSNTSVLGPENRLGRPGVRNLELVGRLNDGVQMAEAQLGMSGLLSQQAATPALPEVGDRRTGATAPRLELVAAERGVSGVRAQLSTILMLSLVLLAFVLLVACANIANLRLSLVAARRNDIAIRLSLGETRGRLMRELLIESVLLAVAGGVVGLLVARVLTGVLLGFLPQLGPFPAAIDARLDYRVLALTAAVSVLTGIVFGFLPAIAAARTSVTTLLKASAGTLSSDGSVGRRLMWGQIAVSTAVVTLALLFGRSFYNLTAQDLGFDSKQVLLMQIDPRRQGYRDDQLRIFYKQLLEEFRHVEETSRVSMARRGFLTSDFTIQDIAVPGFVPVGQRDRFVSFDVIAPGFFSVLGVPFVAGRDFTEADNERAPRVVTVNETMARHFFGTTDVVGRRFTYGRIGESAEPIEIVGVVRDATYQSLREDSPRRLVYAPYLQAPGLGGMQIVIKTTARPAAVVSAARAVVARLDRRVPILMTESMTARINRTMVPERLAATLGGILGLMALVLACLGTYGVTAAAMTRRRNEIGVRLALGGVPGDIVRQVLRESLRGIVAAIAVGMVAGWWIAGSATTLLFDVAPADQNVIIAALATVTLTAAAAVFVPAWRASRLAPLEALRRV